MSNNSIIKIENLYYSYPKKEVLKNINISIESGKITGILGANGSGKSTLLKNILNFVKSSSGAVYVNLKDIKEYTHKELANIFGFVPQRSEINIALTVYEVVSMGRVSKIKNSLSGFSKSDDALIMLTIESLNLTHLKDTSIFSISGGEFQRSLLARALVQEPSILLLDESTSHLDIKHALDIKNIIAKLVKNGLTCITVLHDLNLAGMYCDNIIFLKDGEIACSGKTTDLFNEEILKGIYGFNCKVINNNGCAYVMPSKQMD